MNITYKDAGRLTSLKDKGLLAWANAAADEDLKIEFDFTQAEVTGVGIALTGEITAVGKTIILVQEGRKASDEEAYDWITEQVLYSM